MLVALSWKLRRSGRPGSAGRGGGQVEEQQVWQPLASVSPASPSPQPGPPSQHRYRGAQPLPSPATCALSPYSLSLGFHMHVPTCPPAPVTGARRCLHIAVPPTPPSLPHLASVGRDMRGLWRVSGHSCPHCRPGHRTARLHDPHAPPAPLLSSPGPLSPCHKQLRP